jgi:hypothetical protein
MSGATTSAPAAGLTRYSPGAPVLLVTDYPPDTAGGGAVILRSLLEGPDRDRVVWASPSRPSGPALEGAGNAAFLRRGSAGRLGRRSLFLDCTVYAAALAREAAALAGRVGARAVWVVMHGAGVHVAARLTRAGGLPVHLTVHDDPAYGSALRSRRYLAMVPWVERDFAAALRRARSVDVIGEGMRRRYLSRYGVDPVVVHRALPGPVAEAPAYDRRALGLTVGVLGSTYGYGQLPVLGRAVALAAGRLGVRGRVVVLGRGHGDRLREEMSGRVEVEAAGHVSEAEGVERLRRCFALYLNYPFGARDRVLRQTSFPTKLSTYVQAARPLLLHAPPDSSVVPLADADGYAALWASADPAEGAERLVRLWEGPASAESHHRPAEAVRLRYYDPERNRRAIAGALDALVAPPGGGGPSA